jgi:anti-sigma-K factor RskA
MTQSIDVHTLSGAYALDALSEHERAGFARHLAGCEVCAAEVSEFAEAVAHLGIATSVVPPARLKQSVLAEVGRTRQLGPVRPARRAVDNTTRWRRWTAAAAAAAVIAVGGAATVGVIQQRRIDQAQSALEQAQRQAGIAAVLNAPDVRTFSAPAQGGGSMTVAISPSLDDAVIFVYDLVAPPSGEAIQAWTLRGGAASDAGVLAPGARTGSKLVHGVAGVDAYALTVERAGGAAAPTGDPIAVVATA